MLKKIIVIALVIAIYGLGIISGMVFLRYPMFGVKKAAVPEERPAGTLAFRSDSGNLLIFREAIAEAAKGVVEVEFKNGGEIVKKGTDKVVGVLRLK